MSPHAPLSVRERALVKALAAAIVRDLREEPVSHHRGCLRGWPFRVTVVHREAA